MQSEYGSEMGFVDLELDIFEKSTPRGMCHCHQILRYYPWSLQRRR